MNLKFLYLPLLISTQVFAQTRITQAPEEKFTLNRNDDRIYLCDPVKLNADVATAGLLKGEEAVSFGKYRIKLGTPVGFLEHPTDATLLRAYDLWLYEERLSCAISKKVWRVQVGSKNNSPTDLSEVNEWALSLARDLGYKLDRNDCNLVQSKGETFMDCKVNITNPQD